MVFIYLPRYAISRGIDNRSSALLLSVIGISNTVGRAVCGMVSLKLFNACLLLFCNFSDVSVIIRRISANIPLKMTSNKLLVKRQKSVKDQLTTSFIVKTKKYIMVLKNPSNVKTKICKIFLSSGNS